MTTQPDFPAGDSPRTDSALSLTPSSDTTTLAERETLALRAEVLALRERLDLLERMQAEWASMREMLPAFAQAPSATIMPDADAVVETADTSETVENAEAGGVSSAATSRRRLLQWGGMAAAAGLAAAGGAALTTQTAHAADGDSLILGQSNTANHNTALVVSLTGGLLPPALSINSIANNNSIAFASVGGDHGVGILGVASETDAFGVLGQSFSGTGVGGQSSGSDGIDIAALGTGRLWQKPSGTVGAPTIGKVGEQVRDQNGNLYICVAGGLPGTWQKVAALDTHYQGGAIGFLAAPIRLLDTRSGSAWTAGSNHTLQVTGVNVGGISVPAGAVGVVGNVTVVQPTGLGDLRLYPAGASLPSTSSINFAAGQIIANGVIVGLDSAGRFKIQVDMPVGTSANVLFDASGFIV